jgi:hypothetical protein
MKGTMEKVTTLGIDLAKSVFSLHGVDGGAGGAATYGATRSAGEGGSGYSAGMHPDRMSRWILELQPRRVISFDWKLVSSVTKSHE